jgi:hypothetical protein
MTLRKNPPSLWITLNFLDSNDPIVQLLAGEDIDLDNFNSALGPDKVMRSFNAAADLVASTIFFHEIIIIILEQLFGITVTYHCCINQEVGIFGKVAGYIGLKHKVEEVCILI